MTLSAPATLLTAAATLLAVLVAFWTVILVSRARTRSGIPAPAVTGSPDLECALRIQANTVEQFILFVPSLWLATIYFDGRAPGVIGVLWCLGRILYALGYSPAKPGGRAPGFLIGILATLVLWVLAAIGIVMAWMAVSAS